MTLFFRSFLTIFTFAFLFVSSAQAEIFYWQDPGTKMTLTVPDTWAMSHNQQPDDMLTVIAPSDDAFPKCRMRVREDRRFLIYPQRFSTAIQHLHYSEEFWDDYAGEFYRGEVDHFADDAGLGRGRGSFAEIIYTPNVKPKRIRKALVFASLYRDKAYILECSANIESYNDWLGTFLSVAKSVQFREERSQLPGGHYKQLYGARAIEIMNGREIDKYYGYGRIPKPATGESLLQGAIDQVAGLGRTAWPAASMVGPAVLF